MGRCRSVLLICVFLILGSATAQIQRNIHLRTYGVEDGLSHVTVNCFLQDKFGIVWIGTTDGLNYFNGHDFRVFKNDPADSLSIIGNDIQTLVEDEDGNIWVGTRDGLSFYNRNTDHFTKHLRRQQGAKAGNLAVRTLVLDKAEVFMATERGFLVLKPSSDVWEETVIDGFAATAMNITVEGGHLWISTLENGIYKVDRHGAIVSHYEVPADQVYGHVAEASIVCLTSNGLWRFDKDSGQFRRDKNCPQQRVSAYLVDGQANTWIGTDQEGLHFIDKQDNSSVLITDKGMNALPSKTIRSVFEDREGNIWIGTWGGGFGIHTPSSRSFDLLNTSQGLSGNFVQSVYADSEGTWIGTRTGLNFLSSQRDSIEVFTTQNSDLPGNYIKAITRYQGKIWIGTQEGLGFWEGGHFIPISGSSGLSHEDITFFHTDQRGRLWVGTWNGINLWNDQMQRFRPYFRQHEMDDHHGFLAIAEDKRGHFWMGTYGGGVVRFDPDGGDLVRFKRESADPKGLANNRVWAVHSDGMGDIWVGTFGGGLNRINQESGKYVFERYTEDDGLANNAIIGIERDDSGLLWISSNRGISRFDPDTRTFFNLDKKDGLQGNHFNAATFKSDQGELFFGGSRGLTYFHPSRLDMEGHPFDMIIDKLEVLSESQDPDGKALSGNILITKSISLSYRESIVSFGFSGLSFVRPEKLTYHYRLSGLSEQWIQTDAKNRQAIYTSLPPGSYTFEVYAEGRGPQSRSETTALFVKVTPPWWQTLWFYLACVGALLFLFVTIYNYRIRQISKYQKVLEQQVQERTNDLKKQKEAAERDKEIIAKQNGTIQQSLRERETLLKEIHHRVKNNLQIIANLLYLQSGKFDDEHIRNVLEEGQGRVRSMSLIHQKLYENEDLKSIPFGEYVQELVNEIRSSFGHEAEKVRVQVKADDAYFDVESAVPLGLIINELTTNTFKYAFDRKEEGQFSIYLTREDDQYQLKVSDNGRGLPEEIDLRRTRSLGLRLVRILSDQLEGEYSIDGKDGMSFTLRFAA